MMPRTKRKRSTLTRDDALNAIPVRNQSCRVEELDSGLVRISIPARPTLLLKVMKRLTDTPAVKKIELDEVGSFVWRHCDGRTTVRALINTLCKEFKLGYRESEVSLTQYLATLARRNLIGLALDRRSKPD